MSSLLDSCLGHSVWCLNNICYTNFNKVVDLIANELELYKKFLIVILEVCVILLVETYRKMNVPFHEIFNPLESCIPASCHLCGQQSSFLAYPKLTDGSNIIQSLLHS